MVLCGEWSLRWAHVNFRINEITLLQKIYCSNQSIGESHIYCAQFSLKTCNSSVVELSPTFFFVFVLPKWSLSRTYVLSRKTNNSVCSSMYTVDHKGAVFWESCIYMYICYNRLGARDNFPQKKYHSSIFMMRSLITFLFYIQVYLKTSLGITCRSCTIIWWNLEF